MGHDSDSDSDSDDDTVCDKNKALKAINDASPGVVYPLYAAGIGLPIVLAVTEVELVLPKFLRVLVGVTSGAAIGVLGVRVWCCYQKNGSLMTCFLPDISAKDAAEAGLCAAFGGIFSSYLCDPETHGGKDDKCCKKAAQACSCCPCKIGSDTFCIERHHCHSCC